MSPLFRPLLALAILTAPLAAQSRSTRVIGRVYDASTGRAITGASIHLLGGSLATVVSDSGCFAVNVLRPGGRDSTVEMQAVRTGYSIERRSVLLNIDQVTVDFALKSGTGRGELVRGAASGATGGICHPPPTPAAQPAFATRDYSGVGVAGGSFNGVIGGTAMAAGRGAGGGRGGVPPGTTARVDGMRCAEPCPTFNTEAYDKIVDNPFLAPSATPVSTFSIDVDRASYSNVRRFISQGQRPTKDAVRIEEMLNYFAYKYPEPSSNSEHPFTVTTDVSTSPWNVDNKIVRIALQARHVPTAALPAANLVFLIDVSGSMGPSGRLPLVKEAMGLLVNQLREQDRVAIVTYAGSTGIALEATSGANKNIIMNAISHLTAGGGTGGGAGLRLAYNVARQTFMAGGNNRVILSTDGDFNLGLSSDAEMVRLIEEERTGGTFLTVLGFGMGNLKDSKLEKLADAGNGNYAYIDDIDEAKKTLVREFGGTMFTLAKDVKLQVEFNPLKVQGYRLIGYENRLLRTEDFNNDAKDAGEMGAGHSVTAMYEVIPVGVKAGIVIRGIDSMRYQTPSQPTTTSHGDEMLFVKVRYKAPDGQTSKLLTQPVADRVMTPSIDFRFATAVAGFGMLLRESEYKGTATVDRMLVLARSGLGNDPDNDRIDFVKMVEEYQRMTAKRNDVEEKKLKD